LASVEYPTHPIHALFGEALQKHGQVAHDRLEFRNCSARVKSVIESVVDYSLGGFATPRS